MAKSKEEGQLFRQLFDSVSTLIVSHFIENSLDLSPVFRISRVNANLIFPPFYSESKSKKKASKVFFLFMVFKSGFSLYLCVLFLFLKISKPNLSAPPLSFSLKFNISRPPLESARYIRLGFDHGAEIK